jgi:hypothetical protein
MSDAGPDNLVLELLRAIRGGVAELKTDTIEVKERLGLIEGAVASVSRRVDRVAGDVQRIKAGLDQAKASP